MEAASSTPISTAAPSRFGPLQVGILVVALVALAIAGYFVYVQFVVRPAAPLYNGTPVSAQIGNVTATVSSTGTLIATRQSRLTMQTAGRVKDVLVKLGETVAAGAPLVRLETTANEIKLSLAKSNLRVAQLKLDQLKSGARQEDIAAAEASVKSAQTRLVELQGGALPQDLVQAQSSVDSAAASVRQAIARRDQVRIGATAADIGAAEQSVSGAQSSLRKAEVELERVKAGPTSDELRGAELVLDQARNGLWSQQVSRDATCGRSLGSSCESANAQVASAQSSVTQAEVKLAALRAKPDARDVQISQAAYEAARETARATQLKLQQVRAGGTNEDVRQADASVESALAGQQSAISKLDALKAGAKSADLQAAISTLAQAQASLAAKRTPGTPTDIALAEESVKQADLSVQQAQLDYDNASLTAPFGGVVGAVAINVGEQLGSGTQVVTLVDPKQLRIDVTVDEADVGRVAVGKSAAISFDAVPSKRYAGKVSGISPSATIQQGVSTYTVAISIDNADDAIAPGMTANVNIVVTEKNGVVTVPNRAIRRAGRGQFVEILVNGKPEQRPIRTGVSNDQVTEIVEGVADGDQVIIPTTTTQAPRVGGFPGAGGPPGGGPPPGAQIVVKPAGGR